MTDESREVQELLDDLRDMQTSPGLPGSESEERSWRLNALPKIDPPSPYGYELRMGPAPHIWNSLGQVFIFVEPTPDHVIDARCVSWVRVTLLELGISAMELWCGQWRFSSLIDAARFAAHLTWLQDSEVTDLVPSLSELVPD